MVAVVTQADLPDVRFGGLVQDRTLFAKDVVRFEGEIVAGVAAMTEAIAAEAARLIEVDYEPLPVVSDFVAAMDPGSPLIHPDLATYEKDENIVADGNTMAFHTIVKGDADAAMAEADVVVKGRYGSDASQGVPIEPRAVVAQWRGDEVTIWSSTQVPYAARAGVAQTLQVPEANVRIVVPLLGGGFGAKCDLHFEAQVAALARAAKRPVKLVFSRREEFVAIAQRREGIVMEFETGVTRDGRLVARRAKLVLDKGAYCGEGGFLGQMAAMHACGPYVIDHIVVESYLNYTNNQPSGSVRAPTAPQVCWALEQHMDEVARAIDMDPVELRRRTLIEEGAEGPTRQVFDAVGIKQTPRAGGRDDRLRSRAARRRSDRRRRRLVAVDARAVGRVRAPERRRQRHDRDRRAGERQRRGDGDADVRRRRARHAPRGLHDPVPGHGGRELGHGLVRFADDVQQRAGDPRRRRRRAGAAAGRGVGGARGRPGGPGARRGDGAREGLAGSLGDDRGSRRRRDDPREGLRRGSGGAGRRHGRLRRTSRATRRSSRRS